MRSRRRPRWGLAFLVFYVYAGLGMYMPFNVAALLAPLVAAAVFLDILRGEDRPRAADTWFLVAAGAFVPDPQAAHTTPASAIALNHFRMCPSSQVIPTSFVRNPDTKTVKPGTNSGQKLRLWSLS